MEFGEICTFCSAIFGMPNKDAFLTNLKTIWVDTFDSKPKRLLKMYKLDSVKEMASKKKLAS